jgi:hypothetical protein
MFNFFKKTPSVDIVDQIHNEIDTAQDRLLNEAREYLKSLEADDVKQELEIAKTLSQLGFSNTPTAKKYKEHLDSQADALISILNTDSLYKTIEGYINRYPTLKFLTIDEFNKICKKYKLTYAPADRYIKDIPAKNVLEIANAPQLQTSDKIYNELYVTNIKWDDYTNFAVKRFCRGKRIPIGVRQPSVHQIQNAIISAGYKGVFYEDSEYKNLGGPKSCEVVEINKQSLFIAAPANHFNLKGLQKSGLGFVTKSAWTISYPKDPIVFRYCRDGIQVLSKWGKEANDEMLVNGIDN